MYNWMKWLRLLGGWHFIAATAIKPPKAACQFAADDILLYKICYNIQWIYFTIWEKGKEELSPLQYHFKSLHIISRHYKKSLLRSQIYHGYEELSTDTNYPIWRRQKLPYMKKTRKKKQVCGAACFMAAEIKFSEDVRLSVCPSVDRIVSALYLQQYSSDPCHIGTSYQATSEGVSRVMVVSKFKNLKFWRIFVTLTLSSFDLGSNMTQWYG